MGQSEGEGSFFSQMNTNITRVQKEVLAEGKGRFIKYQDLFVGNRSWTKLFLYELINMFVSPLPGAVGFWLRQKLFPLLLGSVGKGSSFGRNITIRHPKKIHIGPNTIIDDYCLLDAKGVDNKGIFIGNNVFIGRNTILSCKNGNIYIGDNVNIGFNCEIFSSSNVSLGNHTLIAAYSYIIGGSHEFQGTDVPVVEQKETSKGIHVEENVWLGAGVKVLDGVSIGKNAIIGAGAVVTENIPEYSIAVGIPAKVIKKRG